MSSHITLTLRYMGSNPVPSLHYSNELMINILCVLAKTSSDVQIRYKLDAPVSSSTAVMPLHNLLNAMISQGKGLSPRIVRGHIRHISLTTFMGDIPFSMYLCPVIGYDAECDKYSPDYEYLRLRGTQFWTVRFQGNIVSLLTGKDIAKLRKLCK